MRRGLAALALLLCAEGTFARGVPDWVKAVAATPVPALAGNPRGVVLLDETTTTVSASGEIRVLHRAVSKILTSAGRDLGEVGIRVDAETRIKSLHAWVFQAAIPVMSARYSLVLPDGWAHDEKWFNSSGVAATRMGEATVWEMRNIDALKDEPHRASEEAIAARLSVNFIPPREQVAGKAHRTWDDVAAWYASLTSDRGVATPVLSAKAHELTAGKTTTFEKVAAIGAVTQHGVRYVGIEIGIGGYQPHYAGDILANRYGDCKDKVTLMRALLHEAGVASDYVLATTHPRTAEPGFPSVQGF